MVSNKFVVYTALFGDYDELEPIPSGESNIEYICFTDQNIQDAKGWKIIKIDNCIYSSSMMNRYYKLHPHIELNLYEASLYLDSNIKLLKHPDELFNKYLSNCLFSMPKHFARDCIYSEAKECLVLKKTSFKKVSSQMRKYAQEGMPRHYGLGENNILFRRHNDQKIKKIMDEWWAEMNICTNRDQLSLAYVLWKNKFSFCYIEETAREGKGYFQYAKHKQYLNRPLYIKILSRLEMIFRRVIFLKWRPYEI
ncbi:DUF616 domain-containing protein [Cronobacter sakazakii]|nr:glycosyltransferase domain-containing protein [Cronobacter sakazakii]EGT4276051.1 DUF616 domain-containing protein [Cronobacter sakazakii]EGT5696228.1 DUF616 domain-containing protein [Cronobacter sakazakii]EGT5719853.1 DUF616 domain-containing protein [Cronobacter sakazakii]EGT5723289.1 DUF616 domain-containing protein [Cronobacter sakazakii]PPY49426.1 glycosyl transferase [Cronobacter sakazakii]